MHLSGVAARIVAAPSTAGLMDWAKTNLIGLGILIVVISIVFGDARRKNHASAVQKVGIIGLGLLLASLAFSPGSALGIGDWLRTTLFG